MDRLTGALWVVNLARPLSGLDEWIALVDRKLAEAAAAGAKLLLMPEYATAQWLSFAPAARRGADEPAWLADRASEVGGHLADRVCSRGVALIAGSGPEWDGPGRETIVNRARVYLPDGRIEAQDKLRLAPMERQEAGWRLSPGRSIRLIEWEGTRLAVTVCLDVEFPEYASLLVAQDIDLLLVPSLTKNRSGHARVCVTCRARAVELMVPVLVSSGVGALPSRARPESGVGGAYLFLPCETDLGGTGIAASLPLGDCVAGDGPVLLADVPVQVCRQKRRGAAEIWSGRWDTGAIAVLVSGARETEGQGEGGRP
jgi:predicted amidohydrolase